MSDQNTLLSHAAPRASRRSRPVCASPRAPSRCTERSALRGQRSAPSRRTPASVARRSTATSPTRRRCSTPAAPTGRPPTRRPNWTPGRRSKPRRTPARGPRRALRLLPANRAHARQPLSRRDDRAARPGAVRRFPRLPRGGARHAHGRTRTARRRPPAHTRSSRPRGRLLHLEIARPRAGTRRRHRRRADSRARRCGELP